MEHTGGLFGYSTEILRFPEQRFTVVCLCNLSSANPASLSRNVADVYLEKNLQALTAPFEAPGAGAVSDPSPLLANTLTAAIIQWLRLVSRAGTLSRWGESLRRVGPSRFEDSFGAVSGFDNSGGMMKVKVTYQDEEIFTGTKIDELHLNDAALVPYAGA